MAEALRRTFASARSSRNFRLFLSGQFVSAIGTWMNFTASGWLVWRLTHSGAALGVNSALAFGPMLILGAWGGVLADRFNKRKILITTQSAYALLALVMATLIGTGAIELWMVYVLSVATGLVTAIDNPSRQSFYVEMVGEAELTNAVSLNSAAFTGARVIGPAIAGIVIAAAGMAWCFGLDSVSYLFVLGALLAMRPKELHQQRRTTRDRGHMVAGLKYVWSTDDLRRPLIVLAVMFICVFQWQVLLPLLSELTFNAGAREFGLMSTAAGIGAFIGAITTAHGHRAPGMRRLGLFAGLVGVSMLLVSVAPTLPWAMLAMVPVGFAAMCFMITGNTMLQTNAKPEARGRVMALYGIVFLGSTPFGAPLAGWLGQALGPRLEFALMGLLAIGVGAVVLTLRRRAQEPTTIDDVVTSSGPAIAAR
ncbi:MAG: MFS transporter [Actinomycetota bacterium]|jgi:MFS family permease